jgi:DNA-binding MarR family transcriptional regulator
MDSDACAKELLDVVPDVMNFIKAEMRANRAQGLTVPQFRAMLYIGRNAGAPLSGVAEHLALTPAGTSAIVDGLVQRGFVLREECCEDRRKIELKLTAEGRRNLERTRKAAQASLAATLERLSPAQQLEVSEAMASLRSVFRA